MSRALRWIFLSSFVASAIVVVACHADDESQLLSADAGDAASNVEAATLATADTSSAVDGSDDAGFVSAASPTFTPPSGPYTSPQCLSLASSTAGSVIHFTTDNTNPTADSPVYGALIKVENPGLTIRAITHAPGFDPSPVSVATYVIHHTLGATAPVSFSPVSGQYASPISIALATTTSPVIICYTLDGADPTCSNSPRDCTLPIPTPSPNPNPNPLFCTGTSKLFTTGTPIVLEKADSGSTVTIRAQACALGNNASDVTMSTYSFSP